MQEPDCSDYLLSKPWCPIFESLWIITSTEILHVQKEVLQVLRHCKRNFSCVITNFIQESLEKQLQNQRQHLEAKLLEQSEQFEAKLKQQGERFESQLKEHSEKQSEQFQEAVKQLSECHKVY